MTNYKKTRIKSRLCLNFFETFSKVIDTTSYLNIKLLIIATKIIY